MAADQKVTVRIPSDLIYRIDQLGSNRGYSRSQIIRFILNRAVDTPAMEAAIAEEVTAVQAALQGKLQRIRQRIQEILIEELLGGEAPVAHEPTDRALPARGQDVVEGEVIEGLQGRPRRRRRS